MMLLQRVFLATTVISTAVVVVVLWKRSIKHLQVFVKPKALPPVCWITQDSRPALLPPIEKEVFGCPEVAIASSLNLSTWYYLHLRPCDKRYDNRQTLIQFRYLNVTLLCKSVLESCYVWYWDVANWTLIYTREKMASAGSRYCPIPIHGERTARIIQPNGTVDYPGCTQEREPCAPESLFNAHYDRKLEQRINRSPCCRKLTVDVTHHMGRIFDKYNITYFLTAGAVIGIVRDNGAFIPYDGDTDVAVDARDVGKVDKAMPDLETHGYTFPWKIERAYGRKRYMWGCTNKYCRTGPGIAFYDVKDGMITAPVDVAWPLFPVNLTFPLIRRKFEGVEMPIPGETEKYLDYVYGKDKWRTSLQCKKYDGDNCSE